MEESADEVLTRLKRYVGEESPEEVLARLERYVASFCATRPIAVDRARGREGGAGGRHLHSVAGGAGCKPRPRFIQEIAPALLAVSTCTFMILVFELLVSVLAVVVAAALGS